MASLFHRQEEGRVKGENTVGEKTRILLIEDSRFFSQVLYKGLMERVNVDVVIAATLAETMEAVENAGQPFNLALVDLVLPDGPDGEALEFVQKHGIPSIVFTSQFSEDLRERLLAQHVLDYVIKDSPVSLDYLLTLVERLDRNRQITVMVVEDSRATRQYITDLLTSYQFQVIEAGTGQEALDLLEKNPEIRLVITDYHMPGMDGIEMIRRMRANYDQKRLAIIGMSSAGSHILSAKFIKFGANDFLTKPFMREEFFCRIMQNIFMLDLFEQLQTMAMQDALTRLHNRRFFFEAGEGLFASRARGQIQLVAAMVDIDYFKMVNDTYGHGGGDAILKAVAQCLGSRCRQTDVVARFGGEEFALLLLNMDAAHVPHFFEEMRAAIADIRVSYLDQTISVTASFGVCIAEQGSMSAMLKVADDLLYHAKRNGRNRVEIGGLDACPQPV